MRSNHFVLLHRGVLTEPAPLIDRTTSGLDGRFADTSPDQCLVGRRRPSTSVITPAATTAITTTVASASTEAKVTYHLFQSSSMRWPLSRAHPRSIKSTLSRTRLCDQKTMLPIDARVLTARQHDLGGTDTQAAASCFANNLQEKGEPPRLHPIGSVTMHRNRN
jgi:hypothetical protein